MQATCGSWLYPRSLGNANTVVSIYSSNSRMLCHVKKYAFWQPLYPRLQVAPPETTISLHTNAQSVCTLAVVGCRTSSCASPAGRLPSTQRIRVDGGKADCTSVRATKRRRIYACGSERQAPRHQAGESEQYPLSGQVRTACNPASMAAL